MKVYPLVNCYMAIGKSTIFVAGKTSYFDAIFKSYVTLPQGISVFLGIEFLGNVFGGRRICFEFVPFWTNCQGSAKLLLRDFQDGTNNPLDVCWDCCSACFGETL